MTAARARLAPQVPLSSGSPEPVKSREIWGEWAFVVPFAGRVLALQGMHPIVSAGLEQHSAVFDQPWERAWTTISYGLEHLFGDAEKTARHVRELHRPISGTDYAGQRYHAWNREAWTWVHFSSFDATRYAAKAVGHRFSVADERQLYEEWKAAGRLYGVQRRDTPGDLADYEGYLADMIEHRLVPTPASTRLLTLVSRDLPPPPWIPIPSQIWKLGQRPAGHLARTALVGSFPSKLRERHSLPWHALDQAQYEAILLGLTVATTTVPKGLRLTPAAWRSPGQTSATSAS
jgi:uncharacterized protein (DUF2236 family)